MSEWRDVAVEELAADEPNAIATGPFGSNISSKFFVDEGVPVIRGGNLSEKVGTRLDESKLAFVTEEKAQALARSIARRGDLIFTCWGTIGQVGLIDERSEYEEYIVSNKQMKLTPDPEKADSLFLYYLFSGPAVSGSIRSQAIGSSVPGFNLGQLKGIPLSIPSLGEQRRIAHILGTLDDKIELNRRMNRTLEAIARAIFKSWFIDFDPVIDNAILNGKPIPDEFIERAKVRREILGRSQPSPPAPLPEVEGRNYRGGFEFTGLVERARELRQRQTPVEEILWEILRDRQVLGLKFRRQHQIGDYIADFYCHEHKLVIELDGGIHQTKEAKDTKRDAYMQTLGLTVLRIPNHDVLKSIEDVLSRIAKAMGLSPSPTGRGGGEGVAGYRHLFPDGFQDSPLGKIPVGWTTAALSDLTSHLKRGISPAYVNGGGICVLNQKCIRGRRVDFAAARRHDPERKSVEGRTLEALDILVNSTGVGTLGRVAQLWDLPETAVADSHITVVRAGKHVDSWFLGTALVSREKEIEALGEGTTGQTELSRAVLGELPCVVSPVAAQRAFGHFVAPLLLRIAANQREARALAAQRDTLLPKLISGELRIGIAVRPTTRRPR